MCAAHTGPKEGFKKVATLMRGCVNVQTTVQPEILAGILFGGFAKKEAKLILAVFNLTVSDEHDH